ncbi:MAG TPA: M6 family metalloprotease domain-containing protein [Nitrospira sp.]|nr:M6 family metalloprotease domain-containing protein [Nitrospira sp.]
MATPFLGQTFTFTQLDGTTLPVRGWGDQHYAVFETLDGYTVAKDPRTGFGEVARLSSDRINLEPMSEAHGRPDAGRGGVTRGVGVDTGAARAAGRAGALRFGGRRCDERHRERKEQLRAVRMMADRGGPVFAPPQRTTVGDYVSLCLLIDFSDVPATITREEVERFCNQAGYNGFGNNGSVRDYFFESSLGRLRYTNVVTSYYRAKQPKTYYTDRNIEMGVRARELIREALAHWKAQGFDFSQLTADDTGKVYATNVFYAGPVVNNWSEGLWPHAWTLGTEVPLVPGKSAFDYQFTAMGSELLLGTFCHENGHMLCDYPDLYDYGNESAGVGFFCLMCAGNHADPKNPVQISAYLKRLSGWAGKVTNLEHGTTVTLQAGQNECAMYAKGNEEYFLIENRAKTGRDGALPGAGLAVWHVDELGNNSNEHMTAASHYELSLEQADGQFELERSRNERGDAHDLYAGAGVRFADDSTPNSFWWDGTASHMVIDNISATGQTMSFRCTFSNVVTPPQGDTIRRESAPGLPIPDNQVAGISDTIQIQEAATIADMKVTVDISHTYRGDLHVTLAAPWGDVIVLHPKSQGGGEDALKTIYTTSALPPLASWRGRSTQGAWRLEVKDLAPADSGRLNRWVVEFTPAVVTAGPVVLQESPGTVIPDNTSTGVERSVTTSSQGVVGNVEVMVDISHTYIGDLKVSLVSPSGTEVVVHDRSGGQADHLLKTYTQATTLGLSALVGQPIAGN